VGNAFKIPEEVGPKVAVALVQGLALNLGAVRKDMHVAGLGTRAIDARIDSLLDIANDFGAGLSIEE
jgi:hypothetical protein